MVVLFIGYAAAVIEILMGLPQAIQSYKQRNDYVALSGISLASQGLMFFHTLMWCFYAIAVTEIPVLLAHAPAIPIYGLVCLLIIRANRKMKDPSN